MAEPTKPPPFSVEREIKRLLDQFDQQARAEERWACIRAICARCRDGEPSQWNQFFEPGHWTHQPAPLREPDDAILDADGSYWCLASPLRVIEIDDPVLGYSRVPLKEG
jgi:hypothetical protein